MAVQFRMFLLGIVMLTLVGCGSRSFGGFGIDVQPIDDIVVTRSIQYVEYNRVGPAYSVTFTVPESWVGQFQTRARGNTLVFEYTGASEFGSPIFTVDALSNAQYWEQIGSFPGQYKNLLNTADTYIIYTLPIDSFYSGLPDAQFEEFASAVPTIVTSFDAQRVE